ncbi:hypothetical protein [Acinetobacter rathckeae]|uniref:hypothetical protein n=1 Tax=Acinetobacter rathckeae TaxID=2605272 RepID=UPI0018A25B18|nr:hypothetical protein [Acinetobacter rathckeae]MBF7686728.1 hypothetical protein [Acinetobacter rathckeae]
MTVWQQLGIEPTTNLREIKKAYAVKLKQIDQDTQPNQFILLREALQTAQYEAEYRLFDQEERESQDSIFNDDQIANHSIEQIKPTQENEINESLDTLLEELHLTIQQHIVDKNIHFNIREALHEFAYHLDLIEEQTTRLSYTERMDDLLRKYDLDDFLGYVAESSTAPDQINTFSDHSEMAFELSNEKTNPAIIEEKISPIIDELYKVKQLLWEDNINDEVFERFSLLLSQQFDLPLGQQIEIKDQFTSALAELRVDRMSPKYFRFLELWNLIYPDDVHEYNEHHYSRVLQQRLHEYLQKRDLFKSLSKDDYSIFEQLSGTQKFHPLKMLHLQKQLGHHYPNQQVIDVVDQFEINDTASNINYNFLKSINEIKYFFVVNLVLLIATLMILPQFLSSLLTEKSFILVSAGVFIIFTLIIQPMVHAKILAFPHRDDLLYLYQKIWFITGFLMCITASFLPAILYSSLSYLWLVSTVILLGCLKLDAHKNMNRIFQSAYTKFDYSMMAIGIAVLCLGLSVGFYTLGQPHQPWLISYSLISICCLLFPDSFRPLFYTFGSGKNKNDLTKQQFIRKTAIIILLRISFVGSVGYFLISESSKSYIYAASLVFVGLFFTIFDTKKLSSFIKYSTYVIIILLGPYIHLFSIITSFYLYKSLKAKKQLSKS